MQNGTRQSRRDDPSRKVQDSRLLDQSTNGVESSFTTVSHNGNGSAATTPAPPTFHGVARPGVLSIERGLIRRLLDGLGRPSLRVVLWNGEPICRCDAPPRITVTIHDRRTLWRLIRDPFYQFGEAYSEGRMDVVGDLVEFLRVTDSGIDWGKSEVDGHSRFSWLKRRRPKRNTLAGSKENIHRHYDLGNQFYRLWLDEQMLYTCAYFGREGMSLEDAQAAKMDHVCRKLWLKPGETVIEAGCGWGGFALHMARHYDVRVHAFNISNEQIKHARARAAREGLDDHVEFHQQDWREIDTDCDAFVSIGMLEHVGLDNYTQLGRVIRRSLQPNGRALLHTIGQNQSQPFDRWIERRIFPGAYPPTLGEMMPIFESSGFSIHDVENIRLHYSETIWHWLDRFERHAADVKDMFDERFVRAWRLYLAGSFAAFESGRLQLFQVLFGRGKYNQIARTREYQYDGATRRDTFSQLIEPGRTEPASDENQNGQLTPKG